MNARHPPSHNPTSRLTLLSIYTRTVPFTSPSHSLKRVVFTALWLLLNPFKRNEQSTFSNHNSISNLKTIIFKKILLMCLCRYSVIQVIVNQVSISLCNWTTGLGVTSPVKKTNTWIKQMCYSYLFVWSAAMKIPNGVYSITDCPIICCLSKILIIQRHRIVHRRMINDKSIAVLTSWQQMKCSVTSWINKYITLWFRDEMPTTTTYCQDLYFSSLVVWITAL